MSFSYCLFQANCINCSLVLGFLHHVRSEFTDDVSELTVGPIFTDHDWSYMTGEDGTHSDSETSLVNQPRTSCKTPKTMKQYSFHGENLKSRNGMNRVFKLFIRNCYTVALSVVPFEVQSWQ